MSLQIFIMYSFAIIFRVLSEDTVVGSKWFSTVGMAMGTLLVDCMLSGAKGGPVMRDAWDSNPIIAILVFVYVLIAHIALMGVLTGLLLQTVRNTTVMEKEESFIRRINRCVDNVWTRIDFSAEREASDAAHLRNAEEIQTILEEEEFIAMLSSLDVDYI